MTSALSSSEPGPGFGAEPLAFFVFSLKPVGAFALAVSLGRELLEVNSAGIPRLWPAAAAAILAVCAVWIRWHASGGSEIRAGWCRLISWTWLLASAQFGRVSLQAALGGDPVPTWWALCVFAPLGALALYRIGRGSRLAHLRMLSASVLVALVAVPVGMWLPVLVLPAAQAAYVSVAASAVLSVAVCRR